jgi:hypothetical protein
VGYAVTHALFRFHEFTQLNIFSCNFHLSFRHCLSLSRHHQPLSLSLPSISLSLPSLSPPVNIHQVKKRAIEMTLLLIKESPLSSLFGGKWDDPKYYRCISYRFTKYFFHFIFYCLHSSYYLILNLVVIGAESCFFLSTRQSLSFFCLSILSCTSLLAFITFF